VQDLKPLLGALHDNGVDYLLIGGFALYALGYQRGTVDIDRRYGVTIAKVFGAWRNGCGLKDLRNRRSRSSRVQQGQSGNRHEVTRIAGHQP
jgi:hypothetical protein